MAKKASLTAAARRAYTEKAVQAATEEENGQVEPVGSDLSAELNRRLVRAAARKRSSQVRVAVNMDSDLKTELEAFAAARGISMNQAVTIAVKFMLDYAGE
jgi:hypothetical protein